MSAIPGPWADPWPAAGERSCGDRPPEDEVTYPDIDLRHVDCALRHKNGEPY